MKSPWHGVVKVWPLATALVAAIALVTGVNLVWWRETRRAAEQAAAITHTYQTIATLQELMTRLTDVEIAQREFSASGEPDLLATFTAATNRLAVLTGMLRQLSGADPPAQRSRLERLEPLLARDLKTRSERVAAARLKAGGSDLNSRRESRRNMDAIRAAIGEMIVEENRQLAQGVTKSQQIARLESAVNIGGGVVSFGVILSVFIVLWRENSRRRLSEEALRRSSAEMEQQVQQRTAALRMSEAGLRLAMESLEQTAAAAKRTSGQLEAMFQAMQDGVVVFDLSGNVLQVNEAEARINGFASAEAMKKDLAFFTETYELRLPNGDLLPVERWPVSCVLRGETVEDWELRGRRKDTGREWYFSFSGSPICDGTGKQIMGVIITRDITRRKEAEEQVRRAKLQWERTFDGVPDLIAVLDRNDRIVRVNRAMAERIGSSPGACVGQPCYQLVHGTDGPVQGCPHRLAMSDGKEHVAEVHEARLGGDFLVSATPLLDDKGQVLGSVHIARDITERKRLQREILEASDSELSRIGRDLHDGVGQQLTALGLFVASLQNDVRAQAPDLVATVKNLGGELREIIRQVRLLSHGLAPIPFEKNGLVEALGSLAEHTRSATRVDCQFECESEIRVDDTQIATHLFRISQEAVNNALKHSHAASIRIGLETNASRIVLRVSDDGQGFLTTAASADGLGLRAMKYRSDLIGGRLQIDSNPGDGTSITCTIDRQN